MSLLIKALASAEKDKLDERAKHGIEHGSFSELNLEPLPTAQHAASDENAPPSFAAEASANKADAFNASAAASLEKAKQQVNRSQHQERQAAANVFVANQAVQQPASIQALLILGVAGALIIWLGLQAYQYFSRPHVSVQPVINSAPPEAAGKNAVEPLSQTSISATDDIESAELETAAVPLSDNVPVSNTANTLVAGHNAVSVFSGKQTAASKPLPAATEPDSTQDAHMGTAKPADSQPVSSLKLMSKTPVPGVDPTLLAAYEAYGRGDDAAAQTKYRQVLQADTRNVDALLGMAAIALRQSRYADANGWYQKVLDIEPRNSTALSAVANLRIGNEAVAADYAGTESQIKTMLAQQPESANLHAALGNLYAAQNQWPQAQAAYFNASRYAPNSAEYAFNLAVSLDQLGKSALALAQYQRALSLLNEAGHGNLDKAQLEARIRALQQ